MIEVVAREFVVISRQCLLILRRNRQHRDEKQLALELYSSCTTSIGFSEVATRAG